MPVVVNTESFAVVVFKLEAVSGGSVVATAPPGSVLGKMTSPFLSSQTKLHAATLKPHAVHHSSACLDTLLFPWKWWPPTNCLMQSKSPSKSQRNISIFVKFTPTPQDKPKAFLIPFFLDLVSTLSWQRMGTMFLFLVLSYSQHLAQWLRYYRDLCRKLWHQGTENGTQTGVALEVCHLLQRKVQRQDGTKGSFNDSTPTSGTRLFPSTFCHLSEAPCF